MGLITTALPNLIQGVSQQPDAIKFDGQCSEQTNAISSVVDGLQKRPNTRFLARLLQEALDENTFVHMINRSDSENYVVLITPNTETEATDSAGITTFTESQASKLRIFNMATGEECTIIDSEGSETTNGLVLTGNNLSNTSPASLLKALSIADSTFLLNTSTIVAPKGVEVQVPTGETDANGNIVVDADGDPLTETQIQIDKTPKVAREATITIDQGAYDKSYTVEAEVFATGDSIESRGEFDPDAVMPVISFSTTPFTIDSETDRRFKKNATGSVSRKTYYYAHRLTNPQVVNQGRYLKGSLVVKFSCPFGVVVDPIVQLIMEEYQDVSTETDASGNLIEKTYLRLKDAILHSGGHITADPLDHTGYQVGGTSSNRQGYWVVENGKSTPPIGQEYLGGAITTTIDNGIVTATETSGNSAGGGTNTNANTDVIATGLKDEMFPTGVTGAALKFGQFFNKEVPLRSSNVYINIQPQLTNVDFSIGTSDSLSGTGISVAYKEVDNIASLPVVNKNGFKIKVRGDTETGSDDFYVEFKTNSGAEYGEGSYIETVGFETKTGIDNNTLPQELVSVAVNTFKLQNMETEDKLVGDDDTNPLPSFVGQAISNIFFYKSRIGFLSKSNVVMSEAGFGIKDENTGKMRYNFGRTAVTQLLDSDPIDIEVAASKVTNLRSAIGFQEDLILFSENNQFILKGADILTPKTVTINPVTNFDFDDAVDPISVGAFVLFPFERTGFTGIKQLEKTGNNDTYSSTEITEHVPHYIPNGIKIMTGSTSENFIAVITEAEPQCMYCYRYFYSGNNKVMSSWFKFEFEGNIIGVNFSDSTLNMVLSRNNETLLLNMLVSSGINDFSYEDNVGYEHTTLLDCRIYGEIEQGTNTVKFEDSNGAITETSIPYSPSENELEVYTLEGTRLNATNTTAGVVTLPLNVEEDTPVWVGIPYNMKYTFSEVMFKAAAGKGKTPTDFTKMQVRNGVLFFHDTQSFKVSVTPQYRRTYVNEYVPYNVGSSTIGELALSDGAFRFPVMSSAKNTTITVENDSALPSNFSAAEFESFVHGRSARYAQ